MFGKNLLNPPWLIGLNMTEEETLNDHFRLEESATMRWKSAKVNGLVKFTFFTSAADLLITCVFPSQPRSEEYSWPEMEEEDWEGEYTEQPSNWGKAWCITGGISAAFTAG